ncbi:MFS transporter [Mangrovactinospora gilvigrisea]|uniref:MFS transporter n=1 Tax=Mangrovactinospora gilvigrisea TaxID=1428644 RepID=A0A1J7B9H7_9ACTN|nr:MFS transporter [Mangrovactinospora gilvigrisea]OIV35307.1 MFS transporter [Mangrovactinospora gilvigrisea]
MTTTTDQERPARAGTTTGAPPRSGPVLTALAAGFVMAALDSTVITAVGATIQRGLRASLSQLTWIVDGYVLAFAALLLLAGGLANRFGPRPVYLAGLVLFWLASAGAAAAPDGTALVAARLAQGAGAALFMPASLSLLVHAFPEPARRARMLALWSAIVSTAAGIGPTVGGLLAGAFGWRAVFLINLPVGLAGLLLTRRCVPAPAGGGSRPPVAGHGLLVAALAGLAYTLIEGPRLGWGAAPVLAAYAVVVLGAGGLAVRERRGRGAAVLPWTLFRRRAFTAANVIGFLFNFALYGTLFVLGLYLQQERGASPLAAGLEMLPASGLWVVGNLVYGRAAGRVPARVLLAASLAGAALGAAALAAVRPGTPYLLVLPAIVLANAGAGIVSPAMTAVLVDAAGREHANTSGAVLNANRQVGQLVGIAVAGAVLGASGLPPAFLLIAGAYAVAAAAAWTLLGKR